MLCIAPSVLFPHHESLRAGNGSLFSPHSPGFYPNRQDRQYDYPQHQQFQVSLHERQTAEKIPGADKQQHPDNAPDHVIDQKTPIVHTSHSGNERSERPDNGDEPRQNDRFFSVFFIKLMRFPQIRRFEYPGIGVSEQSFPEYPAHRIIDRIARHSRYDQYDRQQTHVHRISR